MTNKTPHKHAALIKAWADGAEIQFRYRRGGNPLVKWSDWKTVGNPQWDTSETYEYRIKPDLWYRVGIYRGKPLLVAEEASIQYWEGTSGFERWLTDKVEYEDGHA